MSGHVDFLLSAAYDGELRPDARAAFDRHLAECSACAAAFAELTTAVDALREQPTARMPHPVRLPEGSPGPERRWFDVPARLPERHRLVAGLSAAGVLVAAAVAAVVVVGHLNSGTIVHSSASAGVSSGAALAPGAAIRAPLPSPQSASLLPEVVGPLPVCSPKALPISKAEALEIPAGFSNHATEDNGVSTGVVATQASSFVPGGTVDIYARLIDDSSHAVSLPCTVLLGPQSSSSSPGEDFTMAVPTPVAGLTVDGQPLLQATVPATAVAGQTYDIVVGPPDAVVILTIRIS